MNANVCLSPSCFFAASPKIMQHNVLTFYKSIVFLSDEVRKKKGLNPQMDSAQIVIFVFVTKQIDKMGKGTHFFGQPVYGQLIKCLNKDKIVEMSRNHGGERYIKSFDGWHHIVRRERQMVRKVL